MEGGIDLLLSFLLHPRLGAIISAQRTGILFSPGTAGMAGPEIGDTFVHAARINLEEGWNPRRLRWAS